jgi:tetratricopeptide (TPR) repeat protein
MRTSVCMLAMLIAATGIAQTTYESRAEETSGELARGLTLLDSGDRDKLIEAIDIFTRAAEVAAATHDCAAESRAWFYLGRATQDVGGRLLFGAILWGGSNHADTSWSDATFDEARKAYQQAVDLDPENSAALNNLALLEAADGQFDFALGDLSAAIDLGNTRRPLYLVNYGNVLAKSGDPFNAVCAYAEALYEQPDNAAAEEKLLEQLAKIEPSLVASTIWRSVDAGYVERAQEEALHFLYSHPSESVMAYLGVKKPQEPSPSSVQRELLNIVAVTLARQVLTPNNFGKTPVAEKLRTMATAKDDIAAGARDLLSLYTFDGLESTKTGWWSIHYDTAPPALDSRSAFTLLARSRAANARIAGFFFDSEQLYLAAVEITNGKDSDAVIDLADLYCRLRRVESLDRLLTRYEQQLFDSHDDASRAQRFRLHAAFGSMYATLGKWGNGDDRHAAIHHLEQALALAADASLPVDAKLVELLATGYDKVDASPARALRFRLEWAKKFATEDRVAAAQKLLKSLGDTLPVSTDAADVIRFQELRAMLRGSV